ncbi:prepilin-type N-terminal cleavage/methylation domain-containing protein [Nodularia sphaerocarpa]|uniref:prepilin-type N-terminal cleavage/methylation domain-containing protein n=2 Tax=Nodularia sphaerocarpa TaxID=137816 RepID=UPI001EFBC60E|nr:prepilin-type N-terminal cleavage/methylation domain-containing protein [Nodularia sphaerocarpa]MDB9372704.1 type II secretion system protein [Nodularia sphaerocarpa CS-585]ULP73637.1 hypothetical protein BDGGKGIB_03295 [Nodularia sphaerocarpa UHCC 0038]
MAADYIREKLNIKLFPLHGRNGNRKLRVLASEYNQQDAGFTMLEMIAVAIIVGILAAIVAPGWLGFVNRQRVNKANDAVLSALLQAHREAQRNGLDYSVSFRTDNNDIPQVAVYQGATPSNWRNLGEGLGIQPDKIAILTNLTATNETDTDGALNLTYNLTGTKTITFDYLGSLPDAELGGTDEDSEGLKIAVVLRGAATSASANDLKRCVIVKTLLGSMNTEKDDKCN